MENSELIIPTTEGALKKRFHPDNLQWSILAKIFFIGTPLFLFSLLGLMVYFSPLDSHFFQLPVSLMIVKPTTGLILVEAIAALGLTGYLLFVWFFRVPAEDCVSWMIKKIDEKD
ncbi:hypothetical protein AB6D66_01435 [Vibrio pomeroyi]|uniref:Uncharacterized protein n=1 Tax=Vibrio pomeroyi TaxID=198832 RepID=A0ABV4MRF2_9VIBR|nr:hypothetical protein [Vibrio atlanticus]MCZ4310213.1 hypothetical protein [Vibrio atlanticus]